MLSATTQRATRTVSLSSAMPCRLRTLADKTSLDLKAFRHSIRALRYIYLQLSIIGRGCVGVPMPLAESTTVASTELNTDAVLSMSDHEKRFSRAFAYFDGEYHPVYVTTGARWHTRLHRPNRDVIAQCRL